MTIAVYDKDQLFVDSKKIYSTVDGNNYGYIENKLKVVFDGTVAYACYGEDVANGSIETMQKAIQAALFSWWVMQKVRTCGENMVSRYLDAWAYWDANYSVHYRNPMSAYECLAINRHAAIRIKHNGATKELPEYTVITGEVDCQAAPAIAYHVYKVMGMKPIEAINAIVDTSSLCAYPINSIRHQDLKDPDYESFINFLLIKSKE